MIIGLILAGAVGALPLKTGEDLDCSLGFAALVAQMKALPKLEGYASRDPFLETFSDSASISLYAVAKPDHPAYPVIVRRKINGSSVATSACGYGDKTAYDQLMQQIDTLNAEVRRNYGG